MRQKMFSLRVKRPWYLFIRNGILLCSLFIASFVQVWGIERSGFFNGREKWAKGFENQRV